MIETVIMTILSLFVVIILKKDKPEYATLVIILASVCIAVKILGIADELLLEIKQWEKILSENGVYVRMLLKMVGITYICEFASNLCKDAGHATLANNVELFGKVMIMVAGIPVIKNIIMMLEEVIKI